MNSVIAAMLLLASAQSFGEESKIKEDAREVGRAVGTAAREVGQEAKKLGKAVGEATKEGVEAVKEGGREFKRAVTDKN